LLQYNQPYVVAIPKDYSVRIGDLKLKKTATSCVSEDSKWSRLSCGEGSKVNRDYDWLLVERSEIKTPRGHDFHLLVRKSITTGELAFYSVFAPVETCIETLVKVAGSRWSIEECFEMAKGETGLDHYEVRTFHGWYRHMIFSMWSLLILVELKIKLNTTDSIIKDTDEVVITDIDGNSEASNSMAAFKKKRILSGIRYKKPSAF